MDFCVLVFPVVLVTGPFCCGELGMAQNHYATTTDHLLVLTQQPTSGCQVGGRDTVKKQILEQLVSASACLQATTPIHM